MEIPNCSIRDGVPHMFSTQKTAKESKVKPINLLNLARPQIRETWPSLSSKLRTYLAIYDHVIKILNRG